MIEQQSQVGRTLVSWRGLPGTGFGGRGFWALNGLIDVLLRWQQRASERTRLADLTERDLLAAADHSVGFGEIEHRTRGGEQRPKPGLKAALAIPFHASPVAFRFGGAGQ